MSQTHPHQGVINPSPERVAPDMLAELRNYPTTQLADAGQSLGIMSPHLRPLTPDSEICGSAVTLWVKPGDILYVLKVPELIQPGDVLVIDAGGRTDAAVIGDISVGLSEIEERKALWLTEQCATLVAW